MVSYRRRFGIAASCCIFSQSCERTSEESWAPLPSPTPRAALTILGAAGAMAEETIGPTTAAGVKAEQSRRGLLESLGI
jgi:hypothetical protein